MLFKFMNLSCFPPLVRNSLQPTNRYCHLRFNQSGTAVISLQYYWQLMRFFFIKALFCVSENQIVYTVMYLAHWQNYVGKFITYRHFFQMFRNSVVNIHRQCKGFSIALFNTADVNKLLINWGYPVRV